MADLSDAYDPTGGEVSAGRDVLPAGTYLAALAKSERVQSKNKPQNSYLNCEFEVLDGPHARRRFWTMFNLWNDNPEAKSIAHRDFNAVKHACGKLNVRDSSELHGIPMKVKLRVKTDSYGEKNEPVSYSPANAVPVAGSGAPLSTQGSPPSGAGGSAPWRRTA